MSDIFTGTSLEFKVLIAENETPTVPVAPLTLKFIVRPPSGVLVEQSIDDATLNADGTYSFFYKPTSSGIHSYRVESSSPDRTIENRFQVKQSAVYLST